jgi:hypothetical protein
VAKTYLAYALLLLSTAFVGVGARSSSTSSKQAYGHRGEQNYDNGDEMIMMIMNMAIMM